MPTPLEDFLIRFFFGLPRTDLEKKNYLGKARRIWGICVSGQPIVTGSKESLSLRKGGCFVFLLVRRTLKGLAAFWRLTLKL